MLSLVFLAVLIAFGFFVWSTWRGEKQPPRPAITAEQIKQEWRKLGFFCELDCQEKVWTLTASRAGLLRFPDLLLAHVADPQNRSRGATKHYGPYGSLSVMTWPDAGFDGNVIRGSRVDLARLAKLIGAKLATARPGELVRISDEFAADSPYALLLDVRADGFDPASADRQRLGAATERPAPDQG